MTRAEEVLRGERNAAREDREREPVPRGPKDWRSVGELLSEAALKLVGKGRRS